MKKIKIFKLKDFDSPHIELIKAVCEIENIKVEIILPNNEEQVSFIIKNAMIYSKGSMSPSRSWYVEIIDFPDKITDGYAFIKFVEKYYGFLS